jgi:hypothetical protein
MQFAENDTSQLRKRKVKYWIEWLLVIAINGALIWIIWNYKQMPVAYTYYGSWGVLSIRAPWGKEQSLPANPLSIQTNRHAMPHVILPLAPPIKLDAHGNPAAGSSYRLYRCESGGNTVFLDTPCDKSSKEPVSH